MLTTNSNLPELGVGIVYCRAIEPLLQIEGLIDVIEVEPQTLWRETGNVESPYSPDGETMGRLHTFSQKKIIHSVGMPIGGSILPNLEQIPLLQQTIEQFQVCWVSEHLGFNQIDSQGNRINTGFFLPQLQTQAGVETVSQTITKLSNELSVPFLIETGVNYLQPYAFEMSDGCFIKTIVERAECGILLDLHNLWANQKNGRQSVEDFLSEIPLDQVYEIHLAGGFEYKTYWLDAHSGEISNPLLEIARKVIPMLPNLRAIIFEIMPTYVPIFGLNKIQQQLETLHQLWKLKSKYNQNLSQSTNCVFNQRKLEPNSHNSNPTLGTKPTVREWENALTAFVTGQVSNSNLFLEISSDKGANIIKELVKSFRAGMIVDALKLTSRLIMLQKSSDFFWFFLSEFWDAYPLKIFASSEAIEFAKYLREHDLTIPYLSEVLAFEEAIIHFQMTQKNSFVKFTCDPNYLIHALENGQLPEKIHQGNFVIEIPSFRIFLSE